MRKIDRAGHRYNWLTVVREDGRRGGAVMWLCRCDCGAQVRVSGGDLVSGRQKSCRDCGRKRQAQKVARTNTVIDRGACCLVDVSTSSCPDHWMLIDTADLGRIVDGATGVYCARGRGGLVYAHKSRPGSPSGYDFVHRLIVGAKADEPVDHINGNTLDNRRSNLRVVQRGENNRNASVQRRSKSGVAGVRWHKRIGKWQASIKVDGKDLHLGYFDSVSDAADVRREAEARFGYHINHGRTQVDPVTNAKLLNEEAGLAKAG